MAKFPDRCRCGQYDRAASYQPPSDWMSWDLKSLTENDTPPPSVRNAARFMCAGAGIEFLLLILTLAAYRSLVGSVPTAELTPQWQAGEVVGGVYIVAVGLTRIGAWLWMAVKNRAGRRWARVLSTVFFVINSLYQVLVIARPIPGGEWQILFPVALWLGGLCAIALLWQRASSEFFTARSPRY
jgi:hypothetical protein